MSQVFEEKPEVEIFCVCTEAVCAHPSGKQCGKPINQSNAKPYRESREAGVWICDDCYERIERDRHKPN
jgi:hypothetical protein